MAVLQTYQVDLLNALDDGDGKGLPPYAVIEQRHTTDLAIGRAMTAMVAKERHLWINRADIGEKEKHFLLDAPVSPSELFDTSVETVVDKFREARSQSAAYKKLISPGFAPKTSGDPGPSGSAHYSQAQRQSVAARAPPPPAGRIRTQKRRDMRRNRKDLREVIEAKACGWHLLASRQMEEIILLPIPLPSIGFEFLSTLHIGP